MSNDDLPFGGDFSRKNITNQVFGQMFKGAAFVTGVAGFAIGFVVFFWFMGTLLPDEAREASDPTPWEGAWSESQL